MDALNVDVHIAELSFEERTCTITLLGRTPQIELWAELLSAAGRSMAVRCSETLPEGEVLKLTWNRKIILAEVVTFHSSEQTAVLRIRHALHTADIEDIWRRWT